MKFIDTSTAIILTMAALICQGLSLEALAYSAKDDVEAARAYNTKPGHNPTAARHYLEAADLLLKQRFFQAKPLLEEVIRLDPRLAQAYASKAYCQTWQEQFMEANSDLTKAIAIDNTNPIFFYRKALCYFSVGQMDEAVNQLNRALDLKPDDADSLRLRARSYTHIPWGENKAIADYTRLINAKVYAVESLCERGRLNYQADQDDKALQDFESALQIDPSAAEAFVGRANLFYKQHKYQPASDNYSAAIVNGTDKNSFCLVQRSLCLRRLDTSKGPATLNAASTEHDKKTK